MACSHTASAADAEELSHEEDLFLYGVPENLIKPKGSGAARAELASGVRPEDLGFSGRRSFSKEFRTDGPAMKAIQDRHSEHTASLPLQSE